MKLSRISLLLITIGAIQTTIAQSFYIGLSGGTQHIQPRSSSITHQYQSINFPLQIRRHYKMGVAGHFHVGYHHQANRVELQVGYLRNNLRSIRLPTTTLDATTAASLTPQVINPVVAGDTITWANQSSGSLSLVQIMFNVWFDFNPHQWVIHPSLGVGIGYIHADHQLKSRLTGQVNGNQFASPGFPNERINRISHLFGYQFMGALRLPINERIDLWLDYRFIGSSCMQKPINHSLQIHSGHLGIRFHFG